MKAYEAAELANMNTRGVECIDILYKILCDRIKGVALHGLYETTVDFTSEMNLRPLLRNYTWGRTSRIGEIKKGVVALLQNDGYSIVEDSAGIVHIDWHDAKAPEEESDEDQEENSGDESEPESGESENTPSLSDPGNAVPPNEGDEDGTE